MVQHVWYVQDSSLSDHELTITFVSDSDIICLQLPTRTIMILGSVDAATELLEKRSHLYSDRVRFVMVELYV